MDPVPLIGRYLYSRWVFGCPLRGLESYRVPNLGAVSWRLEIGGTPFLVVTLYNNKDKAWLNGRAKLSLFSLYR